MKKLLLVISPILFFACDTKGDCGCEVYKIITDENGKDSYELLGTREGYCSQYDLEGYYYVDVNCD